jgi:glucose/arabinose dehydrogenase
MSTAAKGGTPASGGASNTSVSATGGVTASTGGTSASSGTGGARATGGASTATATTGANGGATALGGSGGGVGGTRASGGTSSSAGASSCDASKAPGITRLGLQTVVQSDRLNILVYAAQPPDSDDWYLVDALGYIYVYSNGVLQDKPFLDVSAELQSTTYASLNYDERGLLSIAFAPDYQTSGKFYIALIPTNTATEDHDLILEYKRSSSNPLVADTSTRKAILDLEPGGQDGSGYNPNTTGVDLNKYHNASTVKFGPDGMLYVGLGDGGGQCNSARPGVPQDITSPYGKILRLDPQAAPPYAAAGNPFASNGDARVLHWGLRNPFRFNFDSATGDLFIGDVGQWDYEEIDYAPAGSQGLNFGWPDYEGNDAESCNTNIKVAAGATYTPPITTIAHPSGSGASTLVYAIVSGTVYRGSAIPQLYGTYLFGEYYANHDMRALNQCGNKTSPVLAIHKQCDLNLPNDACFVPVSNTPQLAEVASIAEGHDHELYFAANNNALLKVVAAP